jgi:hypothetical protein
LSPMLLVAGVAGAPPFALSAARVPMGPNDVRHPLTPESPFVDVIWTTQTKRDHCQRLLPGAVAAAMSVKRDPSRCDKSLANNNSRSVDGQWFVAPVREGECHGTYYTKII